LLRNKRGWNEERKIDYKMKIEYKMKRRWMMED